jgi:hypothetical protein
MSGILNQRAINLPEDRVNGQDRRRAKTKGPREARAVPSVDQGPRFGPGIT